ncbi:MAG: TIGR01459 family HAD-type hydrolase [Pseudomonadota bacterium]
MTDLARNVPILMRAADLLARYDVVFCDVWGVVHNGRTAYVDGCAALERFRAAGGTVVLVSNAPRSGPTVAEILADKDVPTTSWDDIVSSGEIARAHTLAQGYTAVHHIGPDRDLDVFDNLTVARVPLSAAQAIFATGLIDDQNETGEDYRAMLKPARERGLSFICANPDLVVDVGGTLLPCAGSIATVYESMGGPVFWAGKPHASAYHMAHRAAQRLRGTSVSKDRILAIGDAVRTDIAGASQYGIESLFIGQGIHREAVMPTGELECDALDTLLADSPHQPIAAMATLAW